MYSRLCLLCSERRDIGRTIYSVATRVGTWISGQCIDAGRHCLGDGHKQCQRIVGHFRIVENFNSEGGKCPYTCQSTVIRIGGCVARQYAWYLVTSSSLEHPTVTTHTYNVTYTVNIIHFYSNRI